jgi:hypothetical protein
MIISETTWISGWKHTAGRESMGMNIQQRSCAPINLYENQGILSNIDPVGFPNPQMLD